MKGKHRVLGINFFPQRKTSLELKVSIKLPKFDHHAVLLLVDARWVLVVLVNFLGIICIHIVIRVNKHRSHNFFPLSRPLTTTCSFSAATCLDTDLFPSFSLVAFSLTAFWLFTSKISWISCVSLRLGIGLLFLLFIVFLFSLVPWAFGVFPSSLGLGYSPFGLSTSSSVSSSPYRALYLEFSSRPLKALILVV